MVMLHWKLLKIAQKKEKKKKKGKTENNKKKQNKTKQKQTNKQTNKKKNRPNTTMQIQTCACPVEVCFKKGQPFRFFCFFFIILFI